MAIVSGLIVGTTVPMPWSDGGDIRSGGKIRVGAKNTASSMSGRKTESASSPSALALARQANEGALGIPVDPDDAADAAADEEGGIDDEWIDDAVASADSAAEEDGAPAGDEAQGGEEADAGRRAAGPKPVLQGKLSGLSAGGAGTSAKLSVSPLSGGGGKGGKLGNLSRSRNGGSKKAASRRGSRGVGSGSLARLKKMNKAMASSGKNPETAAAAHSRQWDADPGGGGGLQGSEGGGVGSGGGSSGGGSVGDPSGPVDSYGGTEPEPDDADKGGGKNYTPYQQMMDMSMALIAVASALLLVSFLLGWAAKSNPVSAAALYGAAKWAAYAAMVCAGIATMIGLAVMGGFGQMEQGALLTGVGGLLTVISYTAAEGMDKRAAAAKEVAAESAAKSAMPMTEKLGNQTITTDFFDMG